MNMKKELVWKQSNAKAPHRFPPSSAHATSPITAIIRTGTLCDGEEEGGAGIEPKTVG